MLSWWRRLQKAFRGQLSQERHGDITVSSPVLRSLAMRHQGLETRGIEHALIGGCALAAHRVIRATADVNFLLEGEHEASLHAYMMNEGFEVLLRTENVSNYWAPHGERIDFVHARRRYTREMLAAAQWHNFGHARVRVIVPEDLIGLKVQSSSNDPSRIALDTHDIFELLREHHAHMDMTRVRMYYSIFKREGELEEMLRSI